MKMPIKLLLLISFAVNLYCMQHHPEKRFQVRATEMDFGDYKRQRCFFRHLASGFVIETDKLIYPDEDPDDCTNVVVKCPKKIIPTSHLNVHDLLLNVFDLRIRRMVSNTCSSIIFLEAENKILEALYLAFSKLR